MDRERTIAFIGAGSPTFTAQIVSDICHRPELSGSRLVFQDIDGKKAETMKDVCQLYANQTRADVHITTAQTIHEAVDGAGYVINAALNGGWGLNKRIRDRVAEETGVQVPVEAQAYTSQLSFLLGVAQEIERTTPDAVLIQCANPVAEGGTLITRETNVQFIGVCHGFKKLEQALGLMGMNPSEAEPTVAGINHDIWLLELLYRGQDAYPRLREWMEYVSEHYETYVRGHLGGQDYQISPAAIEISKYFGLFPVGDTTRASQPHMYAWHRTPEVEEQMYGPIRGRESSAGFKGKMEERYGIMDRICEAFETGDAWSSGIFPSGFSEWQVAGIISSMVTGNESKEVVNVRNNGVIPVLPDDMVVEVPAIINKGGPMVNRTFHFPDKVWQEALRPHSQQIENHVEAYRNRDVERLMCQILANPVVENPETALKILRIWEEEDTEMRAHYRG